MIYSVMLSVMWKKGRLLTLSFTFDRGNNYELHIQSTENRERQRDKNAFSIRVELRHPQSGRGRWRKSLLP